MPCCCVQMGSSALEAHAEFARFRQHETSWLCSVILDGASSDADNTARMEAEGACARAGAPPNRDAQPALLLSMHNQRQKLEALTPTGRQATWPSVQQWEPLEPTRTRRLEPDPDLHCYVDLHLHVCHKNVRWIVKTHTAKFGTWPQQPPTARCHSGGPPLGIGGGTKWKRRHVRSACHMAPLHCL